MAIDRFPGNLRIGVLHETVSGVMNPGPQAVEPKEMLLVLLDGHQRFRIGDREILLTTQDSEAPGPRAVLLRIERDCTMEYLENRGAPVTKVSVTTDLDWLGATASTRGSGLLSSHLDHRIWAPSPAVIGLAAELVAAWQRSDADPGVSGLLRMARGIELYRTALSESRGIVTTAGSGVQTELPKLAELRRYVAEHLTEPDLGPDQLARSCGIGLRSLQRLCRDALGCSPGDFIRKQRFDAAVTALRQGRVSVAQAAFLAGYSSPANFSTAFKRAFGVTPRHLRDSRSGYLAPQVSVSR